jgi:flagellar hook-associated protein 2
VTESTSNAALKIRDFIDQDNSTWHQNISFTSSTLTGLTTGAFTNQVQGQDAQAIVNGTTVYRDTNEIADVLPGVTISLFKADPGVSKTLTVTESTSNAALKIRDFIDKYNTTIRTLKKSVFYDTNAVTQTNPTAGDSTLRGILSQLTANVTASLRSLPGDATITSLADIGISTTFQTGGGSNDENGTLKFDEEKFNAALTGHYDDVVQFFEGKTVGSGETATTYDGFGKKFYDVVQGFMESNTGSLASRVKQLSEQTQRLNTQIQDKFDKIDKKSESMKQRFARLETVLAQLATTQSSLNSLLGSVSLNNSAIAKG